MLGQGTPRCIPLKGALLVMGVSSACFPSDFDALGSDSEETPGQDACVVEERGELATDMCEAASLDPLEPDAAGCDTCLDTGEPEPPDAELCEPCADATADAPMCAEDGGPCEPDAALCGGEATVCEAGKVESQQRDCGACSTGTQSRSRRCSADGCAWGSFSAWSACTGVTAACTPGDTTRCANGDSCGQRVCSDGCSWGACAPKFSGGCLRIGKDHTDEGSNYRCCGDVGRWQFCLPDCRWSTDCNACNEGAPNFCADCYP